MLVELNPLRLFGVFQHLIHSGIVLECCILPYLAVHSLSSSHNNNNRNDDNNNNNRNDNDTIYIAYLTNYLPQSEKCDTLAWFVLAPTRPDDLPHDCVFLSYSGRRVVRLPVPRPGRPRLVPLATGPSDPPERHRVSWKVPTFHSSPCRRFPQRYPRCPPFVVDEGKLHRLTNPTRRRTKGPCPIDS
jgi:hypothetical protein